MGSLPPALGLDSIVALRADVTTVVFDREVMLVDASSGRYHAAGSVGSHIVELMGHERSVRDIVSELCVLYEVEPQVCAADVLGFLGSLMAERLLAPLR